jgi:hypothetical protein
VCGFADVGCKGAVDAVNAVEKMPHSRRARPITSDINDLRLFSASFPNMHSYAPKINVRNYSVTATPAACRPLCTGASPVATTAAIANSIYPRCMIAVLRRT